MRLTTLLRAARAFTLVELLVVVAIMALLLAILLPALGKARLQAKRSAVLANLHSIGSAMGAYEAEYANTHPTNLTDINQDGRAFMGLALLSKLYHIPPKLFINPNTTDTPATQFDALGWPILADLAGTEITLTFPAVMTPADIGKVNWHSSFSYDHERKRTGDAIQSRVYVGDRADYADGRSFSANWDGQGMCLLWTDQHAEFVTKRSLPGQSDPNIYHHNEFGGEGAGESRDGVIVSPSTTDTHLRFFAESEDDALLPND
jgi:prepilin-type N-terminal cleavage/methylation domain-containing protein